MPSLRHLTLALTCSLLLTGAPLRAQTEPEPDTRATDIADIIRTHHEKHRFQGAVLVAEGDKILFRGAYGLANVEHDIAHTPETRFLLASVSKSLTATAILRLHQQGKLDLTSTISHYLPGFRKDLAEKITVHHLLTHTSGLYRDTLVPSERSRRQHFTPDELLEVVAEQDLLHEPGRRQSYSSPGYVLLGAILRAVTGKPLDQALDDLVFKPLNMHNTGLEVDGRLIPRRAGRYLYLIDEVIPAPLEDPSFAMGPGSVSSTVDDLLKWCRALLSGEFLTSKSRQLMLSEQVKGTGYGVRSYTYITGPRFGEVEGRGIGYDGGTAGASTRFNVFLDHRITVIVLSNFTQTDIGGLTNQLGNVALGLAQESPPPPRDEAVLRLALKQGVDVAFDQVQALRGAGKNASMPGFSDFFRLGYAYYKAHRPVEAKTVLELTARAFPKSSYPHIVLGKVHLETGATKAACASFSQALELDPSNPIARNGLKSCGGNQ